MSRQPLAFLLALLLTASAACRAQPAPPTVAETEVYRYRAPSRDGIGKVYMGREIAQVMGYLGLSLARTSRAPVDRDA